MRQLLIVNSGKKLNAGTDVTPYDLSGLDAGSLTLFELGAGAVLCDRDASPAIVAAMPTKNFAIALGRKNNQRAFIIPEVDINTLSVVKAKPIMGNQFSVVFTMPTTVVGKEYTLRFFKKGVVPHERNSWTVTIVAGTTTAATEATAFKAAMDAKVSDKFQFTTSLSTAQVTITGVNFEDWEVKAVDSLAGTSLTVTHAKKPIGDKAYILDLASQCAAGKGFEHTAPEGREFIPGYPEDVEDLTLNASGENVNGVDTTDGKWSTAGYVIYTLRFKVGRDAAKTRDERVWQYVYIAVPLDNNASKYQVTDLDKILPEGDFSANFAKSIADKEVKTLVNSTYLA